MREATVLLVDDRPANLMALEAVLEPLDLNIVKAASGREALRFLLEHPCALILLDVQMPDLDGFETAALIRKRERTRNTPIIFVTAVHREEQHIVRGYAGGAVDYVLKPFDPEVMRSKVQAFVNLNLETEARVRAHAHSAEVQEADRRVAQADADDAADILEQGDPLCVVDDGWTIVRVNRAQESLTGLARQLQVGRNFWQVFPSAAEPDSKYWTQYNRAMRDRVEVHFEDYYAPFRLWTEVSAYPRRAGGLSIFFRNGNGRKDAEERERVARNAAERERAALHQLFMEAPVPISILRGPDLVFELANPSYSALFGRTLLGKTMREALPELEEQGFFEVMRQVYGSGHPYSATEAPVRIETAGGPRDAFFDFTCQPLRDEQGKVEGLITFAYEVTALVRSRVKAEALSSELQQAVRIRDDFLSLASHELNTPLTPLKLQLDVIARSSGANAFREHLEVSLRQVDRIKTLVAQLLDVSRIGAGRLLLEPQPVDLAELTRAVVARFAAQPEAPPIEVVVEARPAGAWDLFRLDQVITNLISNALKYGGGKPVEVTVGLDGAWARLSVVDHGIGVAAGEQERIFGRFERAVPARNYAGLGLGLWIVRQVVEASGGTVSVESALGEGARFTVRLPLSPPAAT